VRGRKNVEKALVMSMDKLTPKDHYSFTDPEIRLAVLSSTPGAEEVHYIFYNTRPITYTTSVSADTEGHYEVTVTYTQNIRMVYTVLDFPASPKDTKRHQVTITALPPAETYSFLQDGDNWTLKTIAARGN
jgi:hypothetical protein